MEFNIGDKVTHVSDDLEGTIALIDEERERVVIKRDDGNGHYGGTYSRFFSDRIADKWIIPIGMVVRASRVVRGL